MGDMNAPLRVRIREGCRGGSEQFKWNSIKDQSFKDREQYLGQSTKVGMMGKFGRYNLHDWYARKRDTAESIDSERSSVQAYEEELMLEALGVKPKKLLLAKKQLSEEELKEFLKRDDEKGADKKGMQAMGPQKKIAKNEYGEAVETTNEDKVAEAAREAPMKGLGFATHRTAQLEEIKAKTFGTESELAGTKSSSSRAKPEVKEEVKKEEPQDDDAAGASGVVDVRVKNEVPVKEEPHEAGSSRGTKRHHGKEEASGGKGIAVKTEEEDKRHKKQKKEEKKQKKADKKLKKLEKKLKKVAKKEKRLLQLSEGKVPKDSSSSSSS